MYSNNKIYNINNPAVIEQVKQLTESNHTNKQIAAIIGISASTVCVIKSKYSFKNLRLPRYHYRIKRFKIEDEHSAYIAGLYWSDGHLSKSSLTITFQIDDAYLITDIINPYVFSSYPAYRFDHKRSIIRLNVFDKQIRSDFFELGLVNNDAGRNIPPIPDDLFRHFLRGLIDGDGHISQKYKKVELAGRIHLLKAIGERLDHLGFQGSYRIREATKSKHRAVKYGVLTLHRYELFHIYKFLYKNANYFLARKKSSIDARLVDDYYLIEWLRRKYSTEYVSKNRLKMVKLHKGTIEYAFPCLFQKNIQVLDDLDSSTESIADLIENKGLEISKLLLFLNKESRNVSRSSLERFMKSQGLRPKSHYERGIVAEKMDYIMSELKSGKDRGVIASSLNVDRRRLARQFYNIKADHHIELQSHSFFETIATTKQSFFLGFLSIHSSINKKYLIVKFRDVAYEPIIKLLATALYGENIPKSCKSGDNYQYAFGSVELVKILKAKLIPLRDHGPLTVIPDSKLLKSFTLGIFYAGLKVQPIKTGYSCRISGAPGLMAWVKDYLLSHQINSKFEKNSDRRLVVLKEEYEKLISIWGEDLHTFKTTKAFVEEI